MLFTQQFIEKSIKIFVKSHHDYENVFRAIQKYIK
jgi:hypothetical protein